MDDANHVFDDVEDALCAPVDENDIAFENHPPCTGKRGRRRLDQPEVALAAFVSGAGMGRSYQAVFATPAAGSRPV